MNEEIFKGKWNQIRGEIQKEWGELTDNDVDRIQGELTRMQGVIQEKYGQTADEVKAKVDEFLARFKEEMD